MGGFAFMKEIYSKSKDCVWLAQQLKTQMGRYVSFNQFGIDNTILTGVYDKEGIGGPWYSIETVRFYIKFCKGEFLRVQIELGCNSNEDVVSAMNELIKALASVKQGDISIGYPLAIYKTNNSLTSEYAFKNQITIIEQLKNNTMFDDGDIENLTFLRICNNCNHGSYSFEIEDGSETLYCTDGGCDTQTQENNVCENHEFEDGEEPIIKVLCKSILK